MNKFTLEYAQQLDSSDPIAHMRDEFHIPKQANGEDEIYLCGNSLGLQPKRTAEYLNYELTQWQKLGVKGHFSGEFPWMPYHEFLAEESAKLVGAKASEVVNMNSLTANLHFMMVSFYKPSAKRHKILIEQHAFPSDHYAVESQIKFHGYNPQDSMLLLKPRDNEETIRTEDILKLIEEQGETISLIMLPGVQYYTGEVFDMQAITQAGQDKGCKVGFDLAHAAGNIIMQLHDWGVDFAAWCSYKYLNSGPGSVAGCFVHCKHHADKSLPRFAGWWGHDKETRFEMKNTFIPMQSAEAWQLSNPPILSLAAIRASLDTIKQAGGIEVLREKSLKLVAYMRELLEKELGHKIEIITPQSIHRSGAQISIVLKGSVPFKSKNSQPKDGTGNLKGTDPFRIFKTIEAKGITCDFRHPNVIRVAAVPLYNSFIDVYKFVSILKEALA
ncbi:MAG: kynureninase [Proteobacteria bacterium]|nr:kynureninase [Pseudomonadota bacterium]